MADFKPITADDIFCSAAPVPRPEWVHLRLLAALDFDELLAYTGGLQAETEALRDVLHEAIQALATVTRQRDQLRHAIRGRRDLSLRR